jgi:hypothetical protein
MEIPKAGPSSKQTASSKYFPPYSKGVTFSQQARKTLLMKVFWGSSPFLYDDILPKKYKIKPRVTTFKSL